jgi:sugar lactone lactonase YvrE
MVDIKVLVDCKHVLGEGPVWDVDEQRLYFVDTVSGELSRCAPDGSEVKTWKMPGEIGSFALRERGGALVALDSGLQFFDFESGQFECIVHPEDGREGVRFNDGKADRKGRFVVASLDLQASAANKPWRGRLFRLDTDLSLHELDTGFWISNGPCWSPDDKKFYITDSRADSIYAYDWDAGRGTVSDKRVLVEVEKGSLPDGSTVDAEGFLWSAACGAENGKGELRRYAPDGTLDNVVPMPTPKITSLTFGGPDLDIAYVTTMSIPTHIADTPLDGKLLAVHGLGVRGIPEPRFGG